MMEPWVTGTEEPNPDYYFGHQNGLSFLTPKSYMSQEVKPLEDYELDPLCAESEIEISNPEPFIGFDCRCRPWYQETMKVKKKEEIILREPYVDKATKKIMSTFTIYLNPDVDDEGVIAYDLKPELSDRELQQFNLDFEKFFITDSVMQTIVIKAENNIRKAQELTEVTHLVDFLVTGESDETQNAKEKFMLDVSDKLGDIATIGDGIFQFEDGSGDRKTLVVSPIYVNLEGHIGTEDKPNTYAFMMGAVPKETIIEVALYQSSDLTLYLACGLALFLSLLLSTYCVHKTSFAVIFPLRKLNMRMTEILQD